MPIFKVGTDDFKLLRDAGGYFVDKSLLIKEVIEGSQALLLPRPRRFGKTLNLSMLRYFFEKTPEDHTYLFHDLTIASMPEVMHHQGKYPVIFSEFEGCERRKLGDLLGEVARDHRVNISRTRLPHGIIAAGSASCLPAIRRALFRGSDSLAGRRGAALAAGVTAL